MNIKRSLPNIHSQKLSYPASQPKANPSTENVTDSFSFSSASEPMIHRAGRGFAGALAGSAFSGLLLSLPLSLAPAMGAEVSTAVNVYKAAVLTCGVAGGLASAIMPPEDNWY